MEFSDFGRAVDVGSKVVLDDMIVVLGVLVEVIIEEVVDSIVVTLSSQTAVTISIKITKFPLSHISIKDDIVLPEILKNNIEL